MAFTGLSSLPDDPLAALPNDPTTVAPKGKGLESLSDDPFAGLPDDPGQPGIPKGSEQISVAGIPRFAANAGGSGFTLPSSPLVTDAARMAQMKAAGQWPTPPMTPEEAKHASLARISNLGDKPGTYAMRLTQDKDGVFYFKGEALDDGSLFKFFPKVWNQVHATAPGDVTADTRSILSRGVENFLNENPVGQKIGAVVARAGGGEGPAPMLSSDAQALQPFAKLGEGAAKLGEGVRSISADVAEHPEQLPIVAATAIPKGFYKFGQGFWNDLGGVTQSWGDALAQAPGRVGGMGQSLSIASRNLRHYVENPQVANAMGLGPEHEGPLAGFLSGLVAMTPYLAAGDYAAPALAVSGFGGAYGQAEDSQSSQPGAEASHLKSAAAGLVAGATNYLAGRFIPERLQPGALNPLFTEALPREVSMAALNAAQMTAGHNAARMIYDPRARPSDWMDAFSKFEQGYFQNLAPLIGVHALSAYRAYKVANAKDFLGRQGNGITTNQMDTAIARAQDPATSGFITNLIIKADSPEAAELARERLRSMFRQKKEGDFFHGQFDQFFPPITPKNWKTWGPDVPGVTMPGPKPEAEPAAGNAPMATTTPPAEAPSTTAPSPAPAPQTEQPVPEQPAQPAQPAPELSGSGAGQAYSPDVAAMAGQVQQLQVLSDQMEARAQQHPHVEEVQNDAEEAADLLQAAKDRLGYLAPNHPLLAPPAPSQAPAPAAPTPQQVAALQPTGHATTPADLPASNPAQPENREGIAAPSTPAVMPNPLPADTISQGGPTGDGTAGAPAADVGTVPGDQLLSRTGGLPGAGPGSEAGVSGGVGTGREPAHVDGPAAQGLPDPAEIRGWRGADPRLRARAAAEFPDLKIPDVLLAPQVNAQGLESIAKNYAKAEDVYSDLTHDGAPDFTAPDGTHVWVQPNTAGGLILQLRKTARGAKTPTHSMDIVVHGDTAYVRAIQIDPSQRGKGASVAMYRDAARMIQAAAPKTQYLAADIAGKEAIRGLTSSYLGTTFSRDGKFSVTPLADVASGRRVSRKDTKPEAPKEGPKTIKPGETFTHQGREYRMTVTEGGQVKTRDLTLKGGPPIVRSWGPIADFEKETGLKVGAGKAEVQAKAQTPTPNGHPEILKGAKALAERIAQNRNRKVKPGENLLDLAQPRLLEHEPSPGRKGTHVGTLDGTTINPYEEDRPARLAVHPKAQSILDKAMEEKDVATLGQILHPGNKGLRNQFEERTGTKLPKGWNATRAAIAKHFEGASGQDEPPKESTKVAEKSSKADTLTKKESPDAGATGGVESGGREAGAHGRSSSSPTPAHAPGRKSAEVSSGTAENLHAESPATGIRGDGAAAGSGSGDVADVRPNGSGNRKPAPGPEALPADQAGDRGKAAKDEQPQAPRNARNHSIESQADINPFDLSSEAQSKKAARANIEALKLLKQLEGEGRKATPEEQKTLAKYVGWGATTLSKMVDWSRGNKALEATKLKEALESLKTIGGNNAAYPSDIIDQVRDVLGWSDSNRMGYSYGRPAVGDLLGKVNQLLDGSTQTIGSNGSIDPAWLKEFFPIYRELADILTPDEMKAAWNSTLNAHYTSVPIVKSIWDMVKRMGFKGGTALEPSAGIGNFLGLMPKDILPETALQAVELDKMTGAFLKHLYPDAKVHIKGFQDAKIANNSQDLVITNVPFGDISISDSAHPEWGSPSIHNYFFLKGMEKLKPGGLMVAISSHYTLDSQGSSHRKAMAAMGDLVGAVRLPRTAFKANAGTEVVTDIIILRKNAGDGFRGEAFQAALPTSMGLNRAGEEVTVPVNEYFKAHPYMVLGEYGVGNMRGNEELTVNPRGELAKELAQATAQLPKDIASRFVQIGHDENEVHSDDEDVHAEGHLFVKDGRPMVIDDGKTVLHPWVAEAAQKWPDKPARAQERAKIVVNYTTLRDEALAQVARMMSDRTTDEELAKGQKALTKAYDAFTMRGPKGGFVPVNDPSNASVFGDESSWARVCALENEVEQENGRPDYTKADIFTKRTIEPFKEPSKADSIADALEISQNMRGGLDLDYMGKLLGKDAETVKQELASQDLAFDDPTSGIWEPTYMYLGGEVRKKLREAQEAAKDNDAFKRHVGALEKVQPEWMQLGQITAQPGATWLPDSAVSSLVRYATGLRPTGLRKDPISGRWALDDVSWDKKAIWDELSVPDEIRPWKFAEAVLLNKPLKVTWKDDDGTHVDVVKTQQAQEAKSRAVERWHEGFYKVSDEGRKLVEDAFNNEVNNSVPINFPEPPADRFPGMATEWGGRALKLESYQKIGVMRALKDSTLLGHAVGSGKTITLIATAMEQRRLGFAKRPMISVLNSTVRQFVNAAYNLYPNAKILAPGKSERSAKDRAKLYARIATGDWDMVIIPQSFYEMIPVSAARVKAWIDDQVQEINDAIVEAKDDKFKIKDLKRLRDSIRSQGDKMMAATDEPGDEGEVAAGADAPDAGAGKLPSKKAPTSKQGAKKAAKTTDRLTDLASRKSDRFATFEDLGIDALLVDEAHGFKNGFFMTSLNNVKGLNPSASSKRAVGMLLKARSIQEKTAGKNITMATGTPITNTMSEAWVMMNYVRPDLLEEGGVSKFDEFISTYGDIASDTEYTAAGKFEPVERLREFVNLQQLGKLWNQAVHVVPQRMILRDKLPTVHYETVMVKPTPAQEEESAWWRGLMDEWKTWNREDKQKVPVGLLYSQISKFLSLDMRTIKRGLGPEQAGGKIPAMVKKAVEFYKQTESDKGAQAIFCDVKNAWKAEGDVWTRLGRSGGEPGFNVFKEVKFQLMKAGVPEHEIVIVDDIPDKDEVRAQVFDKVNNGEVRFIIGSTPRLGTGVNIQIRLVAMHNLDIPGRPCDNTQRKGRGERPGNLFGQEGKGGVHWLTYGVEKTLDALMAQRNLNKTKFIEQIMEGLFEGDKAEDIGTEATFSWAEIRGALSGDPRVMKYGEVQAQIQKMEAKRNAWEQGRGDARVKLANAKREIERFTQESEALSQFAEKVPGVQEEIAKQVEVLKKDKEGSDPLEDWHAAIEKKVQKKDVSSSIGYENRDFPTKLPGGLALVRKATTDWNILDKPGDAPTLKVQVVLTGTGLPESVTPRSGTSSARLYFAMESMSRALESIQEHADVRKRWIAESKESIPVFEGKQGPYPDQEKLNGLRQEASELEAAINESAEAEKKARDEARAAEGEGSPRTGEQGAIATDLLTAPAEILKGLAKTGAGQAILDHAGQIKDALQAIVAPATMNLLSQRAADIHSGKLGQLHLLDDLARMVLEIAHRAMGKLSHDEALDLFDVLEGKTERATFGRTPKERTAISYAIDFMRKTLDNDYQDILKTGKSLSYIENYFPHMYAKPEKARPFLEEYAKRPMEGTKDWAKHRSIPYLSEAVREHDLEPASWNPIDMFLARHFDMQKFLAANQIMGAYKKEKLARYVRAARTAPEGFVPLDDRFAVVSSIKSAVVKNPDTGQFERQSLVPGAKTVYGQYYAPSEVARIFNNYLSPGLSGTLLRRPYEYARTANNLLTMSQLGLSAFHMTFLLVETSAGSVSRGTMQMMRDGDLAKGLGNIAKGAALPVAWAETFKAGLDFKNALLSEDCPPEYRALRDMFIRGGGRVSMDREYGTPFARQFVEGWRKAFLSPDIQTRLNANGVYERSVGKEFWERAKGGAQGTVVAPFALVEALSKPIMEHLVPLMKMGTMAQLFADEIARLPEDASEAEIDRVARKVVDHVEDRMGQMTYDNLHWHAYTKQAMQLGLRAVGWDVGSWRMIGGAGLDTLAMAPRAARALASAMVNDPEAKKEIDAERARRDRLAGEFGHNRWMTYNIAQTFAVMAVVGLIGGLMTWLLTGKPPKSEKDLLYFRTGRKDKYGKDERNQLASYAKEVMDLLHVATEASPVHWEHGHPTLGFNLSPAFKYLWGKRAPLVGALYKFGRNQDWRGQQVYTPNAGKQTLEDLGLATLKEFLPISAAQSLEKWDTQPGGKSLLPAMGFTKPKQENLNSTAENKLVELLADRMPRVIEKAKGDREVELRNAKDAYVLGNRKPMDDLQKEGLLTARDHKIIQRNFNNQSLIVRLSSATNIEAQDLIKVWGDMTPEEKVAVFPAMTRKIGSAFKSTPPAQKDALKEKWNQIREEVKSIKAEPRSSK